ncbi:hypothetical protein HK17_12495 [Acetobacter indonesiensis]|uniref:Uncharacterized protein n=1 Tax=Acetobacter indonesiensis TaxID=104101 RepID=A0A252ANU8_9PROT|nr:hypothetical protein HK17_12495 [Acetobacter indonesiensis]
MQALQQTGKPVFHVIWQVESLLRALDFSPIIGGTVIHGLRQAAISLISQLTSLGTKPSSSLRIRTRDIVLETVILRFRTQLLVVEERLN